MKRAKQRTPRRVKPRNLLVLDPLLRKGGAHQRQDKRASLLTLATQWQVYSAGSCR